MMPNVTCICVCLKSWFSTTRASASRFKMMTTRMPSRFDSSRMSAMSVDDFVLHQVGDALDERRLVHLVRELVDDDRLAIALHLFDVRARAHDHAAAAGGVRLADSERGRSTMPAVGKSGPFTMRRRSSSGISGLSSTRDRGARRSRACCAAECWSPCRPRCRRRR